MYKDMQFYFKFTGLQNQIWGQHQRTQMRVLQKKKKKRKKNLVALGLTINH